MRREGHDEVNTLTTRTRALELKVGLFIAAAAILLVALVLMLGNFSLGRGYKIYVDYDFSGNIQPGAPVKISGIKVGKVEEVRFMGGQLDETGTRRVQVRLAVWLQDRARETLRQDAEFFISTRGVLGEQYLEIVPGDDYDQQPIEPDSVLIGSNPPRIDLLMSRLYEVLEIVSQVLHDERERIRTLLASSAGAVDELNRLLVDNREAIGELIVSGNQLAREATGTLERVNQGLGDPRIIGKTMRDADALLVTANRSVNELTPATRDLLTDATRVTGLLTEERVERALTAADKAAVAIDQAGGLVANVDGLVTDLRQGKGTAGALLVREEIYADLREMIRDLKRNPWKFFWKE